MELFKHLASSLLANLSLSIPTTHEQRQEPLVRSFHRSFITDLNHPIEQQSPITCLRVFLRQCTNAKDLWLGHHRRAARTKLGDQSGEACHSTGHNREPRSYRRAEQAYFNDRGRLT